MGKEGGGQQEQPPGAAEEEGGGGSGDGGGGGGRCGACRGAVRPQCLAALLLGAAVMLSALFWLPPFAGRGHRVGAPDPPGDAFVGEPALRDLGRLLFLNSLVRS